MFKELLITIIGLLFVAAAVIFLFMINIAYTVNYLVMYRSRYSVGDGTDANLKPSDIVQMVMSMLTDKMNWFWLVTKDYYNKYIN